eukprot:9100945-Pyramimonas_sp.AAC.1
MSSATGTDAGMEYSATCPVSRMESSAHGAVLSATAVESFVLGVTLLTSATDGASSGSPNPSPAHAVSKIGGAEGRATSATFVSDELSNGSGDVAAVPSGVNSQSRDALAV